MLAYSNRNEPFILNEGTDSNPIKVIRPRSYITASDKKISFFNTFDITQKSFDITVEKGIKALDSPPSLFYGHFLYPNAKTALRSAGKLGVPCVAAVGESDPYRNLRLKGIINNPYRDFASLDGIVSVSKDNALFCIKELGIPEDKIKVLPNSVNLELFYPRNKDEMRKKNDLPLDKFIVAFTGHFIERKGPHRVLKAIKGLKNVGAIFIGSGEIPLKGEEVLFNGAVEHKKVPELLSAADVFVLPTLAEGSCNAILEAMACGLPVISSKDSFNEEILDEKVAIMIDPLNIENIKESIKLLYTNKKLRTEISGLALDHAHNFNLTNRAEKVIEFCREIINKYQK